MPEHEDDFSVEGGCFCGKIRYKITAQPVSQMLCYCKDCLSIIGTDGYAGLLIREPNFELTRGAPTRHEKTSRAGRKVIRHFCGTCGTNLWGQTTFGIVSVAAGTLDDPELFKPVSVEFTEDAPHWARIPELPEA